MTEDIVNNEDELPEDWEWGTGEGSSGHYTYRFYTKAFLYEDGEYGWDGEIYWDKSEGDHTVVFRQIQKVYQNGDKEYGPPEHSDTFNTKEDAVEYAIEKAAELR